VAIFSRSAKACENEDRAAALPASSVPVRACLLKEDAMNTCDLTCDTARVTTSPAFAMRVVDRIVAFFRAWKNRHAFYRLSEMTDAELADIGLTRSDLHVAVYVPIGADPTVNLRSLANQRATTAADLARKLT
jgi:uncharacterized protein YjiS (DUF1127 family)